MRLEATHLKISRRPGVTVNSWRYMIKIEDGREVQAGWEINNVTNTTMRTLTFPLSALAIDRMNEDPVSSD